MRILIAHNEYGAFSGEEHALWTLSGLLEEHGHEIIWFLRSSAGIRGAAAKAHAFFAGIHSTGAAADLAGLLNARPVDAALVQNLYPLLSPSILPVLRKHHVPLIMRCPNYRLFCPNGLHLSHGEVCERCLGGREYWCILRNCENDLLKSVGYALRNAAARRSRRITANVDRFIVLSAFQKRRFSANGIPWEKLAILPNIAPAFPTGASDDAGDGVAYVGRISPEKGIEAFLSAAARLPDIPFVVAGDPAPMPDLPRQAPANVQWKGFLKGKALDDLYRRTRMLVFPGKWFEGFPNVIARAMAAGKPVVASDLGAIPEIVEHLRCGLLFAPGDIEEMTECIRQLYADPERCRQMGDAGRVKAGTEYSRIAVYQRLISVFKSAYHQQKSVAMTNY